MGVAKYVFNLRCRVKIIDGLLDFGRNTLVLIAKSGSL